MADFKTDTQGQWRTVFLALGVTERQLDGKGRPCPICKEGRDRFTFDDKEGHGTWICRKCGAGNGLKLVQRLTGVDDYRAAMDKVRSILRGAPRRVGPKSKKSPDARMAATIWNETKAVATGDPVHLYLQHRGLRIEAADVPKDLRLHEALPYYDEGKRIGTYPAMLALVRDLGGKAVTVNRHYLTREGRKAPVPEAKKIASAFELGAVRLGPAQPDRPLGIAEGVGTALAARELFGIPVWSAVDAGHLERWLPPEGVGDVVVLGDTDASFTGQAAAFNLAKRLVARGTRVRVVMPRAKDTDWLDVLNDPTERTRWAKVRL